MTNSYFELNFLLYLFSPQLFLKFRPLSLFHPRYVGVFNTLPKTAYIKMIDIWFIFCMVIPFLEVYVLCCYVWTVMIISASCHRFFFKPTLRVWGPGRGRHSASTTTAAWRPSGGTGRRWGETISRQIHCDVFRKTDLSSFNQQIRSCKTVIKSLQLFWTWWAINIVVVSSGHPGDQDITADDTSRWDHHHESDHSSPVLSDSAPWPGCWPLTRGASWSSWSPPPSSPSPSSPWSLSSSTSFAASTLSTLIRNTTFKTHPLTPQLTLSFA